MSARHIEKMRQAHIEKMRKERVKWSQIYQTTQDRPVVLKTEKAGRSLLRKDVKSLACSLSEAESHFQAGSSEYEHRLHATRPENVKLYGDVAQGLSRLLSDLRGSLPDGLKPTNKVSFADTKAELSSRLSYCQPTKIYDDSAVSAFARAVFHEVLTIEAAGDGLRSLAMSRDWGDILMDWGDIVMDRKITEENQFLSNFVKETKPIVDHVQTVLEQQSTVKGTSVITLKDVLELTKSNVAIRYYNSHCTTEMKSGMAGYERASLNPPYR